jgi:putative transposase
MVFRPGSLGRQSSDCRSKTILAKNKDPVSDGYRISYETAPHFLTFTIVDWVDLFTRKSYRDTIINSLKYCMEHKGAIVYSYVITSNHVHIILQSATGNLSGLVRDFKKWTAVKLLEAIQQEPESRREWILHRFAWNAAQRSTNTHYQVWTHDNHPIELRSDKFFIQRMNYIHQNPVRAGWVEAPEDYLYSSAGYFAGRPSMISITDWRD